MKEPSAFSLSQFFSALVGSTVSFSLAINAPDPKVPCMYGLYKVLPEDNPMVMRISLKALALLGGALLGLPEETAIERALSTPIDEPVRDAMHEVLNVASAAIGCESRAVFKTMFRDVATVPPEAAALMRRPSMRSSYRVGLGGVQGESVTLFQ